MLRLFVLLVTLALAAPAAAQLAWAPECDPATRDEYDGSTTYDAKDGTVRMCLPVMGSDGPASNDFYAEAVIEVDGAKVASVTDPGRLAPGQYLAVALPASLRGGGQLSAYLVSKAGVAGEVAGPYPASFPLHDALAPILLR